MRDGDQMVGNPAADTVGEVAVMDGATGGAATTPTTATIAAWYVSRMHWPVSAGTWITRAGRCSCGESRCALPGGHPRDGWWWLEASLEAGLEGSTEASREASTDPAEVRRRWAEYPDACVVVPTGVAFDVVDLPAAPGREALRRLEGMGYVLGPVAATRSDRLLILVRAQLRGSAAAVGTVEDGAVRYAADDVWYHGLSSHVVLPPAPGVRWVHPPQESRPDLPAADDIVGPLLDECRHIRRPRVTVPAR